MRLKVYFGKVCAKHPELKGERNLASRSCVGCHIAESRARYVLNQEAAAKRNREYYERTRQRQLARKKEYNAANKEARRLALRRYRAANRQLFLAKERLYREANREWRLAASREYEARFVATHGVSRATYRLRKKEQQCAVN